MTITASRPATQKQFDFIKRLVAERDLSPTVEATVAMHRGNAVRGTLTAAAASGLIDLLLAQPKAEAPSAEEPEAGVYWIHGDHLVRVYLGQQSGKMLCSRINMEIDGDEKTVSYEYLGLASKHLTPAATPERLPLEEVGSLGITFGHCLICGRRLDVPESVDRGVGPVCAAKY